MAIYSFNMKSVSRAGGSSAVSAAAYRAGERLHDERAGKTYDHSARLDVLHKEIMLPSELHTQPMEWARDRETLWNFAEHAEVRVNSRVAREYMVALPAELSAPQQIALARDFSRELTERYGSAIDLAVHAPRDHPDSDPRNFHAHLLATTREVTANGFGVKTAIELNSETRLGLGLGSGRQELFALRERWATVANEALHAANIDARIDHRTLAAQGIDREPRPHIPAAAVYLERRGYLSFAGERIRGEYEARVAAREGRHHEPAHTLSDREITLRNYFTRQRKVHEAELRSGITPAQRAAEAWRQYREKALAMEKTGQTMELEPKGKSKSHSPSPERGPSIADDFFL